MPAASAPASESSPSWWIAAPRQGFTDRSRTELPRMRNDPAYRKVSPPFADTWPLFPPRQKATDSDDGES